MFLGRMRRNIGYVSEQKIEKAGMTLGKDKCEFERSSVRFLGHVVSGGTIGADPAKVEVIINLYPPTDKQEVRSFMEMVNYLGKFSKNLAPLAKPIYAVMGKKAEWLWACEKFNFYLVGRHV